WWSNAAEHWHARALIPRDARGPSTTRIHHIVIELLPEKRAVFVSLSGTGLRPALFHRWTQGLRPGLLDPFWPVDATGPAPRQRSDASTALGPSTRAALRAGGEIVPETAHRWRQVSGGVWGYGASAAGAVSVRPQDQYSICRAPQPRHPPAGSRSGASGQHTLSGRGRLTPAVGSASSVLPF